MNEKSKIIVFLEIRGFKGDPSKITDIIGISPDKSWAKGEIISESPLKKNLTYIGENPRKKNYGVWRIDSKLDFYSYNVEDYINDIIKKISPFRNNFKKLPKEVNLMLCIWIDIYPKSSIPSISFDLHIIQFLAKINVEIDIDISLAEDAGECGSHQSE